MYSTEPCVWLQLGLGGRIFPTFPYSSPSVRDWREEEYIVSKLEERDSPILGKNIQKLILNIPYTNAETKTGLM
jgi:hypothetical protein